MNMKTKRGVGLGILVILVIFSIELVYAADFTYVISNSEDWKDVYSVMLYANLQKIGSDFLVSTRHGPILLNGIEKSNKIRVISSRTRPFVFNYADEIKARGYSSAEETMVNSANLELIPELTDVNSFIIVGSSYGYDAIAVAPYAVLTRSWVFFADRTNTA
jgi:hypothetical protein